MIIFWDARDRSNKLLLLLSLLSQSLLVFFLCISRAQTMHLERQSLKSIILFIHWAPFWEKGDLARRITLPAEPTFCCSCKQFATFSRKCRKSWLPQGSSGWHLYYYHYYYYYYHHHHHYHYIKKLISLPKPAKSWHQRSCMLWLFRLVRVHPRWVKQAVLKWILVGPTGRMTLSWEKGDLARTITLPAGPTFCCSCKQFATFVRKCRKRWLPQGSSGWRVILLFGTSFLRTNKALCS